MTRASEVDLPFAAFRDVEVRFGTLTALSGLTFDLPSGAVCAIVGPNGAGKTTLLRLLSGGLQPTSGRLDWPSLTVRGRVAMVSQAVALYPYLTLRENCLAAGRMEGVRGATLAARAEAAIAQTHCKGMEDRLAGQLSGGYQRRAAIAAALMGDAPLVILDEPTTGLDSEATEAIGTIARGLRASGKTVVIATHDFALADVTADVALFLRNGVLQAAGPPRLLCEKLYAQAKHVELRLARETTPHQRTVLATLHARRRAADRWMLSSDADAQGCAIILRALDEAGLALCEMHIREPGVVDLFEHFCLETGAP